ncbi:uncharacterized protein BYT42DRAFT_502636 [Radiomyces spectabilis]|uniref:uncharacterized protein n=1 Tax=Radiomyces spectabilis TaxID=64574 RepID=UPI00221FEE7F|nr:uncharacterized protein BYT42DRAFT_502636 [Radiomyces spectabilis]KAI8370393.1 hypothetical protein BYT42DRAFT_502636 [Radiomyces spectabilis]
MYHYGEMAFMILGLKPCVLIQFPHPAMADLYHRVVLKPVFEPHDQEYSTLYIAHDLASDEMSLKDSFIVYRREYQSKMDRLFRPPTTRISEASLGEILDYPGRLPSNDSEIATMREVAYLEGTRLLTTFAAQANQKAQVAAHFERYRDVCDAKIGMKLTWLFRDPVPMDSPQPH